MAGSVGRRTSRTVVAMVVVGALLFGGASSASAQDDAATDQRVVRLVGTYGVQPDKGRVEVVEEITVSNVRGSRRSGNTITSYYWTGHTVWIPADAEGVSIQVEGTELEWEVAETISGIDIITADYRRNLNYGQTRVIDVTYTLPTYGPGDGGRRINGAFFFLDMITCCGFEEVDLTVTVPVEFDVVPPGNLRFESSVARGRQEFSYTDNEVTGQFTELIFSDWSGFNDAGMERTVATFGDTSVELVYPPDDQEWGTDTAADVAGIGAALGELVGVPFPVENLVLRQGRADDFDRWGVSGPFDEPVTLPRDHDRQGLAATLARAWLSDGPFEAGTISDGLALEFASEAVARTGGTRATPPAPTGSSPLGDEGAHWVMRQISDEVGHDGLADLVVMAGNSEAAYVGDGEPEQVATIPADWKRFLDLAEHRLGSERAAPVLEQHVLGEEAMAELERRASALDEYAQLEAATESPIPLGIRTAMTNWDFDRAETLLSATLGVVAERDRIVGDSVDRESDADLALGQVWADAESVEDLEAVRSSLLDRERALDRGRLVELALVGVGLLALIGGIVGALLFRRRRNSKPSATVPPTSDQGIAKSQVPETPDVPSSPPAAQPAQDRFAPAGPPARPFSPDQDDLAKVGSTAGSQLSQDPSAWAPPTAPTPPMANGPTPPAAPPDHRSDATTRVPGPVAAPTTTSEVERCSLAEPQSPLPDAPSGAPRPDGAPPHTSPDSPRDDG